MSIRAESHIRFSTYHFGSPEASLILEMHDRISTAIMNILEDMELERSHIQVECQVGYAIGKFYGTEGEDVYLLGEEDE
jgi:hypothetical protein